MGVAGYEGQTVAAAAGEAEPDLKEEKEEGKRSIGYRRKLKWRLTTTESGG